MTDSEAELRREIEAKLAFWRKHELKDIYFPLEEIMLAIANHDQTVEQAAAWLGLNSAKEIEAAYHKYDGDMDWAEFVETKYMPELLAALQTKQPGEEQQ